LEEQGGSEMAIITTGDEIVSDFVKAFGLDPTEVQKITVRFELDACEDLVHCYVNAAIVCTQDMMLMATQLAELLPDEQVEIATE